MDFTPVISRLIAWLLHNEMDKNDIGVEDVIEGIKHMNDAYNRNKISKTTSENATSANFETAAFRCAYLHKFATIHAVLVSDITQRAIHLNYNSFRNIISNNGCLNICSLGGGPGSDLVGMLIALNFMYGSFHVTSYIVDCMPSWNETFSALVHESQIGPHGQLSDCFSDQYFRWNYIGANLLQEFSEEVKKAISSANIVNMIKFLSAAACVDTQAMIKRIFELMKPGAIVFFVDNSIGDIKFVMNRVATECKMEAMLGPIDHEHYVNPLTEMNRFGYLSCYQTKIAIQVWRKPQNLKHVKYNQSNSSVENISSTSINSTPIIHKKKRLSPLLSSPVSPNDSYNIPQRHITENFNDDSFFEDSFCSSPSNDFQFLNSPHDDSNFSRIKENPHPKNKNMFLSPSSSFPHTITSTPFAVSSNTDSGYFSPYSPYGNELDNQNWNNQFSHQYQIPYPINPSPVNNNFLPFGHPDNWNSTFDYNYGHDQINSFNFESNLRNCYPISKQHTFGKIRGKFHTENSNRNVYSDSKENVNTHSFNRNSNRNQRYQPYMTQHRSSNYAAKNNKPSSQLFRGRLF